MPYTGNPNYANPNYNPQFANPGLGAAAIPSTAAASGTLGLSDRDLFDILLAQHKLLAETMTQTILESSHPQFRQDCINILNRDFMHQRMIWEAMNQRGWYGLGIGTDLGQNISQQQQQHQPGFGQQQFS